MRFDSRNTGIDPAAVYAIADRFGAAAELVDDAVYDHMVCLTFGGFSAGRAHTARGDALRGALGRLTAELSQWSSAMATHKSVPGMANSPEGSVALRGFPPA